MLRTLRKFKRKVLDLSVEERRLAAAAVVCAPVVEVTLRTAGLRRTLDWIEWVSAATRRGGPTMAPARAEQIINGVYRLQPWLGKCLPRALLQYGLQRQRGADVRFVVGVKRPADRTVDAHAWVEMTAGPQREAQFAPILESSVA